LIRVGARLAAAALALACAHVVHAQAPARASAAQVKAAFVVNFVRYTNWPRDAFADGTTPYRLCALGKDETVAVLERLEGETRVGARAMAVQRLAERGLGSDATAALARHLRDCHVLYVAADARDATGVLALLADADVLTVGDVDGFAAAGGMLELVPEGARIAFRANPAAIAETRLEVSAKVLKLARLVAGGPG
jgi:hypothetical protein